MSGLRQGVMRVFGHQYHTSHKSTTAVAHNSNRRLCFHLNTQHTPFRDSKEALKVSLVRSKVDKIAGCLWRRKTWVDTGRMTWEY